MESTKLTALLATDTETQAQRIFRFLQNYEAPLSRNQIAEILGLRLASVCGRVNELLRDRQLEIGETTVDPRSGHLVETVRILK